MTIRRRGVDSHKGDFGHVLVIAGSQSMTGAAYLAALGALRVGAGLVTVASVEEVCRVVRVRLPEAMTLDVADIFPYIKKRSINALAIGPGLGVGNAQKRLIQKLLALGLPTVLDADGLNNLTLKQLSRKPHVILTPHEGELSRLLGVSRFVIHSHRKGLAQKTARATSGVCVLKGHRTIIASLRHVQLNQTGNPAMAAGGMGDVLTGVISGLLAQGLAPFEASCLGVYLHGLAGDLAAVSDRGLLASELAMKIPYALKKMGTR